MGAVLRAAALWPGQCDDWCLSLHVSCLQLNPASSGLYSVLETICTVLYCTVTVLYCTILQLNPASSGLYPVLETIFSDMLAMFSPSSFHMGGDEIHVGCWNSSDDITQWLQSQVGLLVSLH